MKSLATPRFWQLYYKLPDEAQDLALKNYRLWLDNPSHPSLRFRRLEGKENLATVRIGDHYRALGILESDQITCIWIGTHAEYDKLIKR